MPYCLATHSAYLLGVVGCKACEDDKAEVCDDEVEHGEVYEERHDDI